MYELESQLIREFENNLINAQNPFAVCDVAFEFYYNNGKVDIIGKTQKGNLVAFDAKLSRWRIALNQAYRNTSFAHYSYVVLPESSTKRALKELHEFERRGVGLCSVGSHGIKVEIPVIMLTAKRDVGTLRDALIHGADDYIRKPFNKLELIARIKAKLGHIYL